jgi:hypothetical protein
VSSNKRAIRNALVMLAAVALIGPMIGGTLFGPGGMWENNIRRPGQRGIGREG